MNIADKIIRGDDVRKSRLHDELGNCIGAACLLNLLRAMGTYIVFKLTGNGPQLPWISYKAVERIDGLLNENMKVLEFGSGMSTIWFARRCGAMHSIEHHEGWFRKVSGLLENEGLNHVRYNLKTRQDYTDIGEYEARHFDFCLVDGIERLACVKRAIPLIKSGGYLYLDNSDIGDPERHQAVALMTAAAEVAGGTVEFVTDFSPMQLHANQGLLVRL